MNQISVIMPVYNQEKYVADAIKSILKQTFTDFEFIIVDDGSTDKTVEIIESFDDRRIRLIRAEHKGFLHALKLATKEASGKWLARMDSDDVCTPDRFERQMNFLAAHPECVFLTAPYGIVTPNDKFLSPVASSDWRYLEARDITLATTPFCDPATVYDRELAIKAGYDDRWENEKPLWYKLLNLGRGIILDEPLYFIRWRIGSHSRGQIKHKTDINYEIRLEYDAANAASVEERKTQKNNIGLQRRSVYYYAVAGDFKAAREVVFDAFRNHPISYDVLKMFLISVGIRRPKNVKGFGGVTFVPVPAHLK